MPDTSHRPKTRIAHLAGPNATIHNTPPLVTSNKARRLHDLPLLSDVDGNPSRYDPLRPQRLAAPVWVYIEQFSAHPLEADAAELYCDPDGYLDAEGRFSSTRTRDTDVPVFKVELRPEDGYYPLPYMARQHDGSAWDADGISAKGPRRASRQPFMPDGERVFIEVDRLGVDALGLGNSISNIADVDFFRVVPSGGFTKGRPAQGQGHDGTSMAPEVEGRDFFAYRPVHLARSPPRASLARIANAAQKILSSGRYDGALWTQGSPRIEETIYWLNLVLDVTIPICGNASQRYHGETSNDGPRNLIDSVHYIRSQCWADTQGHNRAGAVLVQDQRVFAAREAAKVDARPGGYIASGGHGGVIGAAGQGRSSLRFVPCAKHTRDSAVNITRLPFDVAGITVVDGHLKRVVVAIKNDRGELLEQAIPKVAIIKDYSYSEDEYDIRPDLETEINSVLDQNLHHHPLSGFVLEGLSPYGKPAATSKAVALEQALFSGLPVVIVGRGNSEGFAMREGLFVGGSNLTATKARLLLMLCLMKFGMLPPAADPAQPTALERATTEARLRLYREVFETH